MFVKLKQKVFSPHPELIGQFTEEFEIQEGFINYSLIAAVASDDKGGAYVQLTSGQTINTVEDPERLFRKIEYVMQEGLVYALLD